MATSVLWQRLDCAGHELCVLEPLNSGWQLKGTALVAQDALPCKLEYVIQCDDRWQTQSALIKGHIGQKRVSLDLVHTIDGEWTLDGSHVPDLDGCVDIDLGFSPSTNLLPMRRLALDVGDRAEVSAAWLRFPELTLEVLQQVYTRTDADHYLYESADGAFRRNLSIGADGFVIEYPGYWRAAAVTTHN